MDDGTNYSDVVQVSSTSSSGEAIDAVATSTVNEDDRNSGFHAPVGTVSQTRIVLSSVVATPGGGLVFDVRVNGDPIDDNDFSQLLSATRLGTTAYPLP